MQCVSESADIRRREPTSDADGHSQEQNNGSQSRDRVLDWLVRPAGGAIPAGQTVALVGVKRDLHALSAVKTLDRCIQARRVHDSAVVPGPRNRASAGIGEVRCGIARSVVLAVVVAGADIGWQCAVDPVEVWLAEAHVADALLVRVAEGRCGSAVRGCCNESVRTVVLMYQWWHSSSTS